MLHTCVDHTFVLSGKFIVWGDKAIDLLSMLAPSMMKIDDVPVSAMVWFVAIVRAFKYCGKGLPNRAHAVTAIEVGAFRCFVRLDLTIVMVSSFTLNNFFSVEVSKEHEVADIFLHLCATKKSLPHTIRSFELSREPACASLWCMGHTLP